MECSICHKLTSTEVSERKYDVQWKKIDGKWYCGECLMADKKPVKVESVKHSTNKHMLQFPDTCESCFFQHKCKNREGVDFSYCGIECDKIWDNYNRKL